MHIDWIKINFWKEELTMNGITITNLSFTYPDDKKQKMILKDMIEKILQ